MSIIAPATLEGWYVLHQMVALDWTALRGLDAAPRRRLAAAGAALMDALTPEAGRGWSAAFRLAGGAADLLFVHFRDSVDEISRVELALRRSRLGAYLTLEYDFLSVTEAGLYHLTAEVAAEHDPSTEAYHQALAERSAQEGASRYVKARLYPRGACSSDRS